LADGQIHPRPVDQLLFVGILLDEVQEVALGFLDLFLLERRNAAVEVLAGVLGMPRQLLERLRLLGGGRLRISGQATLFPPLFELVRTDREGLGQRLKAHFSRVVPQEPQLGVRPTFGHLRASEKTAYFRERSTLCQMRGRELGPAGPLFSGEGGLMTMRAIRVAVGLWAILALAGALFAAGEKMMTASGTVAKLDATNRAVFVAVAGGSETRFVWAAETKINGTLSLGAKVTIRYTALPDGQNLAHQISVAK